MVFVVLIFHTSIKLFIIPEDLMHNSLCKFKESFLIGIKKLLCKCHIWIRLLHTKMSIPVMYGNFVWSYF